MSWSPQQDAAIKAVLGWMADRTGPQIMRVFGFAGTGKTTIAKEIAEQVKGTVLFAAFTVVVMSYKANRLKNDGTAEEHEAIACWMRQAGVL